MRIIARLLLSILLFLVIMIVGGTMIVNITPKLVISLARMTVFPTLEDNRESGYYDAAHGVTVLVDLEYPSEFSRNEFDLYKPNMPLENIPTLIWIHGGGYIGGSKYEQMEYALELATRGYTVIVMNYELIPTATYPSPIIQVGDLVNYLHENEEMYNLNMENVFFAGNSAGGQILSQFLTIQTNEAYARKTGIKSVISTSSIKGALFYSTVFDMKDVATNMRALTRLVFWQTGWSYFEDRNWVNAEWTDEVLVKNDVTADFPPTFVTDGNTLSFQAQAESFVSILEKLGVSVTSRFFALNLFETHHDFQFQLDTEAGQIVLEDTLQFLDRYRK